jgi:hypothetical protein
LDATVMKKAAKKAPPKRRPAARRAAAGPAPPPAHRLLLPHQFAPIVREVRRDPLDLLLAASDTCQQCFSACTLLPAPLQAICHRMCATVCTA